MKERTKFLLEWERRWDEGEGRLNVSAVCRQFGVSRRTGYDSINLYQRNDRFGEARRYAAFANVVAPNTTWCVDFKGQFRLKDGRTCYPLTILDAHTRFLIHCEALAHRAGQATKERPPRTLPPARIKAETASPPAANLRAQQRAFDLFRREYNQTRPHEALGQKPPANFYERSTRTYPRKLREPERVPWHHYVEVNTPHTSFELCAVVDGQR